MQKIKIDSKYAPFPKPIALIGSLVGKRPNFMTIAWFNRMSMSPNMWMISINKNHHTLQGIKNNKTFSMNFPNPELVEKTDYCGLISGREIDKSYLFDVFYGELETAPLIRNCPISIELKLQEIIERLDQMILLGEVDTIYSEDKYLTEGELDPRKMRLLAFMKPGSTGNYYVLGDKIAKAWEVGKKIKTNAK